MHPRLSVSRNLLSLLCMFIAFLICSSCRHQTKASQPADDTPATQFVRSCVDVGLIVLDVQTQKVTPPICFASSGNTFGWKVNNGGSSNFTITFEGDSPFEGKPMTVNQDSGNQSVRSDLKGVVEIFHYNATATDAQGRKVTFDPHIIIMPSGS
jgi:hypothetical protein